MALARPPGLSSQSVLPSGHTAHRTQNTAHISVHTVHSTYTSHGSQLLRVHKADEHLPKCCAQCLRSREEWQGRSRTHKNVVQDAQAQDVAHDALAQDVVPNVSEEGKSGKVVRGGTQP